MKYAKEVKRSICLHPFFVKFYEVLADLKYSKLLRLKSNYIVEQPLTLDSISDCFHKQENNCNQQNVNMLLLLSRLHTDRSIKQLVITCLGRKEKYRCLCFNIFPIGFDSQLQRFMFGSERAPMNGSGQT